MPQSSKKKKDKKKDKQKCVELAPAVEETREETLLCLITEQSEEATSLGRCVGNVKKILQSSIAQPVPEVGPCGQREILEGLMALLPEDMAQILWYNKSRVKNRICPACLRLYNVGDELAEPKLANLTRGQVEQRKAIRPQQVREQEISGLCSPECFLLASIDLPKYAVDSVWGRMEEEISDVNRKALDDAAFVASDMRNVLGLVTAMTRKGDLGLKIEADKDSFDHDGYDDASA